MSWNKASIVALKFHVEHSHAVPDRLRGVLGELADALGEVAMGRQAKSCADLRASAYTGVVHRARCAVEHALLGFAALEKETV